LNATVSRRIQIAAVVVGAIFLASGAAALFYAETPAERNLATVKKGSFDIRLQTVGVLDASRAFQVVSALPGDRGKIIQIVDDGAKVESASGRAREGRDSHAKQLPTDAAAYDPGNGISDRAQTSQSTFPLPVPCATPGAGRHALDCKSRTPGKTRRTDAA